MTAGLYIHFPFCEIRCGYCDFFTITNRDARIPAFLDALKSEFQIYSRNPAAAELLYSTLYFGGGTPSLLQPAQLADIIEAARSAFHFHDETEITLETNPGTVNFDRLRELLAVGINRLSIGVQSFHEEELRFLDRDHTATDAVRCFDNARKAGFPNISIDLIFSLPGQDIAAWRDNLKNAVSLQPDHISAYNLTFEDGTPLTTQLRQGRFRTLPDETQREMHLLTIEKLSAAGLEHYEISNYAVPDLQQFMFEVAGAAGQVSHDFLSAEVELKKFLQDITVALKQRDAELLLKGMEIHAATLAQAQIDSLKSRLPFI